MIMSLTFYLLRSPCHRVAKVVVLVVLVVPVVLVVLFVLVQTLAWPAPSTSESPSVLSTMVTERQGGSARAENNY